MQRAASNSPIRAINSGSFASHRARMLAGASFLFVGLAIAHWPAHAQSTLPSTGTRAVPTYESVGLYWTSPAGAAAAGGCEVKYRKLGDTAWAQGLSMWYDARNSECRGSLVHLVPDTRYQVEFNVAGQAPARALEFNTWSNQLPVARVVTVVSGSATLDITEGGSATTGYVVYQGAPGTVLDGLNASQYNVSVNASYVVVRGLTLKGAKQDAIRISPNVKDVVIEDNDISGWGRLRTGTWGVDMDSGIRAECSTPTLERVTIQRNKIHDPRYGSNSWSDGHPAGPQAITISYCGGNHVIRHNDMYSSPGKYFNDVIGGEDNYTDTGFPHSDTDIYANKLSHAWDDAIEAEGANKNVRIWGNYIDQTAIGVATTVTATGPVYIFRNVYNRSRSLEKKTLDTDEREPFFKSGSDASLGNGRRYVFHNTMLQATQAGVAYGLGAGAGMGGTGSTQLINNTISKNNIYHLWKPNSAFYQVGTGNEIANDMYNGNPGTAIVSGINATPVYAAGNGWTSEANGQYQLAAGTPGYNQGTRIANFNDAFTGTAPDVGAHEGATAAMKFGIAAAAAPAPQPPPPPPPPPTGKVDASSALASSANPSTAGQSVTFTASISGSAGTPTGTVNFRDGATSIAGCAAVALANGTATCATGSLAAGSHSVTAAYSGDTSYNAGTTLSITQTVNGASPPPGSVSPTLGIDSSKYTSTAGESVTFTVTISGSAGTPTGTVNFRTGSTSIAGCAAVALSAGKAMCTTASLAAGSHSITGLYSGAGSYSAGQAGPIPQTVIASGIAASGTLTSTSYTVNAGQYVTFVVRMSGSSGVPRGTIDFRDGAASIPGCAAKPIAGNGGVTCTARLLVKGSHSITGRYSGNATYGAGIVGPITLTVR